MEIREGTLQPKGGKRQSAHFPDEWFDGKWRVAKQGVDFDEERTLVNYGEALRRQAIKRGLKITVSITKEHPGEVHFQTHVDTPE